MQYVQGLTGDERVKADEYINQEMGMCVLLEEVWNEKVATG